MRLLVSIDELVALVRARATLAAQGQQEFAETLGGILKECALDVSASE
jgi:hypothetical protein